MSRKIYYFSGTGNSLYVAKELAALLQCTFESIPRAITHIHKDNHSHIIIVFPSYLAIMYGIPVIIKKFIESIPFISKKKITAICSCGGYAFVNAVPSVMALEKYMMNQGGSLFDYYTLRLPMNNQDYDHIPIPIEKNNAIILNKAKNKVKQIALKIQLERNSKFRKWITLIAQLFMKPMYYMIKNASYKSITEKAKEPITTSKTLEEVIHLTDRSITVNNQCIGCGLCVNVCPVKNIILENKRPIWLNRCEMCFACHEWCPQKAISHWGRKAGIYYHHPEVSIDDFLYN